MHVGSAVDNSAVDNGYDYNVLELPVPYGEYC